jgi:uncharacterized protein (TIGR02453 family)
LANRFRGFSPEAIEFLRDLKNNNDREWFAPRKEIYEEQVRLPMIELVSAVHGEMLGFAPQYVGEPAKCVFRIYRDTRFSKDKTPYKTHIGAAFWRNGLDKGGAGFYVGISPEDIHIGGGLYGPDPATLLAVRTLIAKNFGAFRKTFASASVKKLLGEPSGESATRPPKGFDPEDPAIEYLKRRQHVFMARLDPVVATTPKLFGEVVKRFEAMTPFIEFMNQALAGTRK